MAEHTFGKELAIDHRLHVGGERLSLERHRHGVGNNVNTDGRGIHLVRLCVNVYAEVFKEILSQYTQMVSKKTPDFNLIENIITSLVIV